MRTITMKLLALSITLLSPLAWTAPIWLDNEWNKVTTESEAEYYLAEELTQNKRGWPVKIYFKGGDTLAFEVTLTSADLANADGIGEYKIYHSNGQLKEVGYYNDKGEIEGVVSFYNEEGRLFQKSKFVAGKRHGKVIHYKDNGSISRVQKVINGKLEGDVEIYYANGWIASRTPYENGEKHGLAMTWYQPDKVRSQTNYVRGKRHGESKEFYKSGNVELVENYVEDKISGRQSFYFDQPDALRSVNVYDSEERKISTQRFTSKGQLKYDYRASYTYTQIVSDAKEYQDSFLVLHKHRDEVKGVYWQERYDKEGSLISRSESLKEKTHNRQVIRKRMYDTMAVVEENYLHGMRNGDYSVTSMEGELMEKGQYLSDKKVGVWEYSYWNKKRKEHYNALGQLNGRLTENHKGQLIKIEHYRNGQLHGDSETYNYSGDLITKGAYVDGKRDGAWQYEDGASEERMLWTGTYELGKKIGAWKAYSAAGYELVTANYDAQGLEDGVFYTFVENGQLARIETYSHGKKVSEKDFGIIQAVELMSFD